MNNPKVSVIVPVYNTEKTLHRCLDSIIAQTYTDWECILIDDGSKDNSPAICDEYEKVDIRFKVIHKKNGGASSARNVGLKEAKGEWICFCDADDVVESHWLYTFEKNKDNVDLVISSFNMHHFSFGVKHCVYDLDTQQPKYAVSMMIGCGECGFLWNKSFRTDIIREYNIIFNESYQLYEDEEFVTNFMSHAKRIRFVKEITYNYYVPDNFDKKYKQAETFKSMIQIYNHILKFVPQDRLFMNTYSALIDRMLSSNTQYYYNKKYKKALENLKMLYAIKRQVKSVTLPLNRRNKFLFCNRIRATHVMFILLSLIHKL